MYHESCSQSYEYQCKDEQQCETEYETVCDGDQDSGGYGGGYQEPVPDYSGFDVRQSF